MRKYDLQYVSKLVHQKMALEPDRRPRPMPGKKWPTRVAWYFHVASTRPDAHGNAVYCNRRTLAYVGKPSRYRALEARAFLQRALKGSVILEAWQAEFDKAGLTAYLILNPGFETLAIASGAFTAYHPHSSQVEVVEAFTRPVHLKYVGGMRIYSQKKSLKVEELDAYYEWFHKTFKRRLRRPKAVATQVIAGQVVEPELESGLEAQ